MSLFSEASWLGGGPLFSVDIYTSDSLMASHCCFHFGGPPRRLSRKWYCCKKRRKDESNNNFFSERERYTPILLSIIRYSGILRLECFISTVSAFAAAFLAPFSQERPRTYTIMSPERVDCNDTKGQLGPYYVEPITVQGFSFLIFFFLVRCEYYKTTSFSRHLFPFLMSFSVRKSKPCVILGEKNRQVKYLLLMINGD